MIEIKLQDCLSLETHPNASHAPVAAQQTGEQEQSSVHDVVLPVGQPSVESFLYERCRIVLGCEGWRSVHDSDPQQQEQGTEGCQNAETQHIPSRASSPRFLAKFKRNSSGNHSTRTVGRDLAGPAVVQCRVRQESHTIPDGVKAAENLPHRHRAERVDDGSLTARAVIPVSLQRRDSATWQHDQSSRPVSSLVEVRHNDRPSFSTVHCNHLRPWHPRQRAYHGQRKNKASCCSTCAGGSRPGTELASPAGPGPTWLLTDAGK